MAVLIHIKSKNANYGNAIDYLTKQYNEKISKPIKDEHGVHKERKEYKIKYLDENNEEKNIEEWEKECIKTSLKYNKNRKKEDIKTHQYIIGYDPRDNVSVEYAHELSEEFFKRIFKGYKKLLCTHPANEKEDEIIKSSHSHVIINSIRNIDLEIQPWMKKNKKENEVLEYEYKAGYKHNCSDEFLDYIKKELMEFSREKGLHQIDLTAGSAKDKKSKEEWYVEEKLKKEGKITTRQYIKNRIKDALTVCKTQEQYFDYLKKCNIVVEKRGQFWRYRTVDSERWIRERSLGQAYDMTEIEVKLAINKEKEEYYYNELLIKNKKKSQEYRVSMYDEEGNKRTLLEQMLMLAIVIITGENPLITEGIELSDEEIIAKAKVNALHKAIEYAYEMGIETPEELRNIDINLLNTKQRRKVFFVKAQVVAASNEDHLYIHNSSSRKKQKLKNIIEQGSKKRSLDEAIDINKTIDRRNMRR